MRRTFSGAVALVVAALTAATSNAMPAEDSWAASFNACPKSCHEAQGPADWTSYHSVERLAVCNKTMLLDFAVHNSIDRKGSHITIRACTEPDQKSKIPYPISIDSSDFPHKEISFEFGSWGHANASTAGAIAGLDQIQQYLASASNGSVKNVFGMSGETVVGLYLGQDFNIQGAGDSLSTLASHIKNGPLPPKSVFQYCGVNSNQIFGVAMSTVGDLASVQSAIASWDKGICSTDFDEAALLSPLKLKFSAPQVTNQISQHHKRTMAHGDTKFYRRGIYSTTQVAAGDICAKLASAQQTIYLSTDNPPMPAPVENAVCGLQVPGTKKPTKGTKFENQNSCPLNAYCNVWDQCGITQDFCTSSDSATGAPGSAAPGENGYISHCGTKITNNETVSAEFRKVGYFEIFNKDCEYLNMDISQFDISKYTHIHFAFAGISDDYNINVTGVQDQFDQFTKFTGVKKILSFGGWSFSISQNSFSIFRQGITEANQQFFAKNMAIFLTKYKLDGLNFDWEYSGAPDLSGIPAGSKSDGSNYLSFLQQVRSLLPAKSSLSIAVSASFWYLKGFPINAIADVVDYIIYMTYNLHRQMFEIPYQPH
ncbi:hypothetical protein N7450_001350 [Penicillium hetheringtonii]|uniref:chitinase n=1 Tax=Penicillium hetheringtonii TaxID=911720 RepID=A0AAD6E576_9EURO|nr:hypothetical protein N7450_001350 [Penicillium hetheringtonii]